MSSADAPFTLPKVCFHSLVFNKTTVLLVHWVN